MAHNMRIALFSGNYNYVTDGSNMTLNKLVFFLERNGVEVLVFSPTSSTPAFKPAGTLIPVGSVPVPLRREYRIGFGLSERLKRQIKDFQPTLFHLAAPDILGHSALKLSEALGIPAVASFHTRFDTYLRYYGFGWAEPFCRNQMAKFYNRCQHVYVPGHSVGKVLVQEGILGNNLRIWSRGVDRQRFHPKRRDMTWRRSLGISDEDIILCFVGRLVREKGLSVYTALVEALAARGLQVRSLVVGDGPEGKSLRKHLSGPVMTGHLSGNDLARAYASSDLFINPSRTETFGNVTLEAMASGLPSICLKSTGSNDLVQDSKTGLLAQSVKSANWIDGTAKLCRNHLLRGCMGRAARQASAAYDWERVMQGLLSQYAEVMNCAASPTLVTAE